MTFTWIQQQERKISLWVHHHNRNTGRVYLWLENTLCNRGRGFRTSIKQPKNCQCQYGLIKDANDVDFSDNLAQHLESTYKWPFYHRRVSFGLFLELRPRFKSWYTRKIHAELVQVPFGKILILTSNNVSWANICQTGSEWLLCLDSQWKVHRAYIAAGQHTWRSIRCYPLSVIMGIQDNEMSEEQLD